LQNINEVSIIPGVPSPKSNSNLMFAYLFQNESASSGFYI